MEELDIKPEDRRVVVPARQGGRRRSEQEKGNEGIFCGAAIELHGRHDRHRQELAADARRLQRLILNAIKQLAGIPDRIHLLSPSIIESIRSLKRDMLGAEMSASTWKRRSSR